MTILTNIFCFVFPVFFSKPVFFRSVISISILSIAVKNLLWNSFQPIASKSMISSRYVLLDLLLMLNGQHCRNFCTIVGSDRFVNLLYWPIYRYSYIGRYADILTICQYIGTADVSAFCPNIGSVAKYRHFADLSAVCRYIGFYYISYAIITDFWDSIYL